jgi:uncharacterized protein (TIGR00369 family)
MIEHLAPRLDNPCIGCGGSNPRGLHLAFDLDHERRRVACRVRPGLEFQGSQGMLHGGIIALILDEVMGKLSRFRGVRAVTAELQIEYLRTIPADADLLAGAEEVSFEGRNLACRGEIRLAASADGPPLARARARFVALGPRN